MRTKLSAIATAIVCVSCSSTANIDEEKQDNLLVEDRQKVGVVVAQVAPFDQEIISNGKIVANQFADVYWEVNGTIKSISTANGRYISEGSEIAQLDAYKLKNSLESSEASMENSRLSMKEILIGQGYNPDSTNIPDDVRRLAEVKSGYLQSLASYNASKYEYENSILKAPISGVVANLSDRPSNKVNQGKVFCRIIDQNSMCAEFTIIESELPIIKNNSKVEIRAFSVTDKYWTGHITEINPYVESNGMVRVKAQIDNAKDLFEGMNINIKICSPLGNKLAVPKSAVVIRSNKQVVFVANNGKASWCYVNTADENSDHIVITKGINEGDSVIVSGNTYLAHNSEITIDEDWNKIGDVE